MAAPENPLRRRISLCHSVETDDQDAAAAWKEGTRRSLWKRAGYELELEPWVSLWSNHFGEESTPPLAWTEGNKMPPAPPGKRGTRGIRAIKSTAVESERPRRKNRSIRGFRLLSYICICAKFFFPLGFFFLLHCLVYVYIFNSRVLPNGCLPLTSRT